MSSTRLTLLGFLLFSFLTTTAVLAQTPAATPRAAAPAAKAKQVVEPPLEWRDVTKWGVEGRAFGEMERGRWFDRFPAAAELGIPRATIGRRLVIR